MRLHNVLLVGGLFVVLCSAGTLTFAARRITAEQAAYSAPSAGRCTPATLNRSAVLLGTSLAVSPLPDSYDASPYTQMSLLGAPPGALGGVRVRVADRLACRPPARLLGSGASFVPFKPSAPADGDRAWQGQGRLGRAGRSPTRSSSPTRIPWTTRLAPGESAARLQREPALPYAPGTRGARDRGDPAAPPRPRPGFLFAAPYAGPGPADR